MIEHNCEQSIRIETFPAHISILECAAIKLWLPINRQRRHWTVRKWLIGAAAIVGLTKPILYLGSRLASNKRVRRYLANTCSPWSRHVIGAQAAPMFLIRLPRKTDSGSLFAAVR